MAQLPRHQLLTHSPFTATHSPNPNPQHKQTAIAEATDEEAEAAAEEGTYEYLLSMPLSALTHEKVSALQADAAEHQAAVAALRATTEKDMWRSDLADFVAAYDEFEEEAARKEAQLGKQQAKAKAAQAKKVGGGGGRGMQGKQGRWWVQGQGGGHLLLQYWLE